MEPCSTQKLASLCSGGPVALDVSPLLPLLNPTSCLNDTASVTEVLMHQLPDDTLFVADENAAAGHGYDMRTLFDEIEKSEIGGEPAEEATRVERGAKLLIAELEKANPAVCLATVFSTLWLPGSDNLAKEPPMPQISAFPSIKALSVLLLVPLSSTSLPWWTTLSIIAEASLSSPRIVPHLLNSMLVVNTALRFS